MFKRHRGIQGVIFSLFFVFCYACGSASDSGPGPRTGEAGKVTFSGGGGCNSSTTLAVGSTTTLTMESAEEGRALPGNLEVRSTNPGAVSVAPGTKQHRVVVSSAGPGETVLEVRRDGAVYDQVSFSSQHATAVELNKPTPRVLAGGAMALKLGEVYGACGKDCPLIGGGFIKWSAGPAAGLTLLDDVERTVTFRAGKTPGKVTLTGVEPVTGKQLVDHAVQIVPLADVVKLSADAMVALAKHDGEESKILDPAPAPLSVPQGSLLLVRVTATTKAGQQVSVWGRDVNWTVEGAAGVAGRLPMGGDADPAEGPIFSADGSGKVTLVGKVALLARTVRLELTITPAP